MHKQSKLKMRTCKTKTVVTNVLLLSKNCILILINPVSLFQGKTLSIFIQSTSLPILETV